MFTAELMDDDHVSLISLGSSDGDDESDLPDGSGSGRGRVDRHCAGTIRDKRSAKGKGRAAPQTRPIVGGGEEFDITMNGDSVPSEPDLPPEPATRKKIGKKAPKTTTKRATASPTSPKVRKRNRTGTITQGSMDEAFLAQATAALQVEETSTRKRAQQSNRASSPATPRPVPTSQPRHDSLMAELDVDVQMGVDPQPENDTVLADLLAPGGQLSPESTARLAEEAMVDELTRARDTHNAQGHESTTPPSPLSSAPDTSPAGETIEETTACPAPESIAMFSPPAVRNHGKGSSCPQRGLLGGAHPGVLGSGKDGSGRRGKVSKTYGTGSRKSRR